MTGRTIAEAYRKGKGGKASSTSGRDKRTCQASTSMRYCAAHNNGYKHPNYSAVLAEWGKRK